MIKSMDINCDMGEGFANWVIGDDPAMMKRITTANVACGFHAGDAVTMLNTVRLAKANGVAVGSHPGFPDLLGFWPPRHAHHASGCLCLHRLSDRRIAGST